MKKGRNMSHGSKRYRNQGRDQYLLDQDLKVVRNALTVLGNKITVRAETTADELEERVIDLVGSEQYRLAVQELQKYPNEREYTYRGRGISLDLPFRFAIIWYLFKFCKHMTISTFKRSNKSHE